MDDKKSQLVKKERYNVNDLIEIVKILRGNDGCPWDKVQTHKTIKKDFIEEVYEVLEAIDKDSPEMMREELGDVLLQVVFHIVIENEQGHFDLEDVTTELCEKLIVRHPHVFGNVEADSVDKVLKNWDAIKKETKGQETFTDTLKSVPKNFPALMRAQKLGKRSSRARTDFQCDIDGVAQASDCVNDEVAFLNEVLKNGDNEEVQKRALGDLLFACCNMARAMGFDAEEALSEANDRYIDRFEKAENEARRKGKDMSSLSINELDALWRKV